MYITRNDCIDIAYTPAGNDKVESIVTGLRTNNPGRVIPESRVLGFDTPEEVDDWMRANPERVLSAVHFEILEDKVVQFGIQTNSTPRFFKNEFQHPNEFVRLPLQHAVQREVVREMIRAKDGDTAANELVFDVDVVSYPRPATESVQMEGIIVPFL